MPIPPVAGQLGLSKTPAASLVTSTGAAGQLGPSGLRLGPENYGGAPGVLLLTTREREVLSVALQDFKTYRTSIKPMDTTVTDWMEKEALEAERDARHGASTGRAVRNRIRPEQPSKQAAAASPARTTASSKVKGRAPKREAQVAQRTSARVAKRRNSLTDSEVGKASILSGSDSGRGQSGKKQDNRHGPGVERQQQLQQQQQQPARHQKRQQTQQPAASWAGPSMEEKVMLQNKIDKLNADQLERVLDFLQKDLEDNCEEEEVQLNLESLPPDRRQALVRLVDQELREAEQKAGQTEVAGSAEDLASPDFPAMEPDDSPSLAPTAAAVSAAKRQVAWEACSAREVQRQSHLRDMREAACRGSSGSSGPQPFSGGEEPPPYAAHASQPGAVTMPVLGHSEDSMLDSSAEVINAVDVGWM